MSVKGGFCGYKVAIISLGCAKNRVNTEQMTFLLSESGFQVTGDLGSDGIDVVLLNTCGFIESASSEAIGAIVELGEMKQKGLFSKLVVAGCLSERYKDDLLLEMPEIDAIVGTGAFDKIVDTIGKVLSSSLESASNSGTKGNSNALSVFGDIHAAVSETGRVISTSPTWAYLKIAEGCDNNCAYCVIPSIRGRFRSRPIENIVNEARNLVESGIRELIIVAQDVTMYGIDLYNTKMLVTLLEKLCDIIELRWIRLHYLYPNEINDNLIDSISKSDKIVNYLDIPIQHVNSNILKLMNRRGTKEEIRRLFNRIRMSIPDVVIRTSIIAGLPGEGEKEFEELYEFLEEMKIERVGIFTYSPEEGSSAAEMEYPRSEIAAERASVLVDLQSVIMDEFDLTRIGSVETVLIEGHDVDDGYFGRSFAESPDIDGYIYVEGKDIPLHDFVKVRILSAEDGILRGIKVT